MAEFKDQFLAQTLNSRQLLALLFICESKRKQQDINLEVFQKRRPAVWDEILSTFGSRFTNLAEALRFEVIEAHLMSVEDIDIYNDETLKSLIRDNRKLMDFLANELNHDPRFQLDTAL